MIGPILFNLFINDLCELIDDHKDVYADDVACVDSNSNFDLLVSSISFKLNLVNDWCRMNYMKLNWSKSFFMIFSNPRGKKPPTIKNIVCDNFKINRVKEFKYLGIWLDEHMTFSVHCNHLIKKLSQRLGYLSRLKRLIPPSKLPDIVKAIAISNVEYGIQIWGSVSSSLMSSLQRVMDTFLKRLYLPIKYDLLDLYEKFKVLRFEEYCNYYTLLLAKNFASENVSLFIPNALIDFVSHSNNHRESISSKNFIVPVHKTCFYQKSLKYRLVSLWNKLPNLIKTCHAVKSFKFMLNQNLVKDRVTLIT